MLCASHRSGGPPLRGGRHRNRHGSASWRRAHGKAANGAAAGVTETIPATALPNGTGPYFVRVFGNALTADVQLYEVDIVIADAVSTATLTVSIAGSGTGTRQSFGRTIACSGSSTILSRSPDKAFFR